MLVSSRLELITAVAAPMEGLVVNSETSHERGDYLIRKLVIIVILLIFSLEYLHYLAHVLVRLCVYIRLLMGRLMTYKL